ncbi:hypothetical protein [Actinomadura rubrisoli]|uniref:Uncharacterized protein n=1 Tax=Actinomadura rubrisoli TaxID=2530368 RepID=A0A4R5CJY7_9ACTN|nr:hypothetical protein [Actinomadura rubrisoli]TDD97724.1 hypothetical protein E1298_01420 [Actinomadura rubrisoli]
MAADSTVKPGQTWADNDKRAEGRTFRVESIDGDKAICTVLTNTDVAQQQIDEYRGRSCPWARDMRGKATRISLSRFKPTNSGYRLVQDAAS